MVHEKRASHSMCVLDHFEKAMEKLEATYELSLLPAICSSFKKSQGCIQYRRARDD